MAKTRKRPLVCSIGSTDPTAAAGIGLDLRVYAASGVDAAFAVAAVTAQNAAGVRGLVAIEPDLIAQQLQAIWEERPPDALRIGLLPSSRAIGVVVAFLRALKSRPPVVLDPVLAASSGTQFSGPRELAALRRLMPLATIVTPNAVEAQALSGLRALTLDEARKAAAALSELGCAVLVKGGHLSERSAIDVLAIDGRFVKAYRSARLRRTRRGMGCLLAAALAVELARGKKLDPAIATARAFVRAAPRSSYL